MVHIHSERPNHPAVPDDNGNSAMCKNCGLPITWLPAYWRWDHANISEFPISTGEIAIKINRARSGMFGTAYWSVRALVTYPAGYFTVERLITHLYPIKGNGAGGTVPNGYTMAEALAVHSAMIADLVEGGNPTNAN